MSKTQFLLFLIAIIPLANCLIIKILSDSNQLVNLVSKSAPVLFLMSLIGLLNAEDSYTSLMLFENSGIFSFGFAIDKMALIFLVLLNFIWIASVFYSSRFLALVKDNNLNEFATFLGLIIAVVNFIIISKSLLTIIFFYNILLFSCHFFAVRFLYKTDHKLNLIFTFLLYLEAVFLFFAAVVSHKFSGQIEFSSTVMIIENLSEVKQIFMLSLYLCSLFLLVLTPSYLLYRHINLSSPVVYAIFFLGISFSSIYVFIKLLIYVFGFKLFSQINFSFLESILLINLLISAFLLVFWENLKSAFFYLLFNQTIFAIFSIYIFATFDKSKIYLPLISFSLGITLVFICISNFILYLSKAEDKSLVGLFYELRVSSVLLIFGILNLAGLAPALGMFEKFFIIKTLFQKELLFSGCIFVVNLVTLVAFAGRLVYSLLSRVEKKRSDQDLQLAKSIDYDSSLILTALVMVIIIILLPIIFQLKNGLFSL